MLKITRQYMTKNDCYKDGRMITSLHGFILHSTATKGVMARAWFKIWNKPGIEKAVQAFVDNKEAMQYLPWLKRAWHTGPGEAQDHYIGVEMCEDNDWTKEYFTATINNAVELFAKLCKDNGKTEKNILSHKEAAAKGYASNHGDPEHWFLKFGYTMDMFRKAVHMKLNPVATPVKVSDYYKISIYAGETKAAADKLKIKMAKEGYIGGVIEVVKRA